MANLTRHAIVSDGDNTLWAGNVAKSIGIGLLLMELGRGRPDRLVRGIREKRAVEKIIRNNPGIESEVEAQRRFYKVLIDNGVGTEHDMQWFAERYIRKNLIPEVHGLLQRGIENWQPVFLSTASGTTTASAVFEILDRELRGSSHNEEVFRERDGKLIGFNIRITTGESKLHETEAMLDAFGLRLSNCIVIGDSDRDIPMLMSAGIPVASPLASDEVKKVRRIIQM